MNKNGQIVVIDDDLDDQDLISQAFKELEYTNELVFFADGHGALQYLMREDVFPFIIISDINLPRLNGFALRKMVHSNEALSKKCIPYLFFSTSVSEEAVHNAYAMSVQGFFLKPHTFEKLKNTLKDIVEYWRDCYAPNNYMETGK